MAKPRATYLYTETRLNLDQATTSSTVELVLPDYDASNSRTPHNPERTIITRTTSSNEDAFSRENLASEGSIFFRRENRYPRTFLWRLLDLRKVLELQSVDLTQGAAEKTEALLTLRLRFPDAVRPFGVAFGDSDEKDALVVFAITKAGELYTITLHKDIFVHHKSSESLAPDWCKVFVPPAFRIREAFRLSVVTAHELFVSLSDGGLLRLNRNNGDNGEFDSLLLAKMRLILFKVRHGKKRTLPPLDGISLFLAHCRDGRDLPLSHLGILT
jgi:DNA repair protein RAD51/nuclear pore complex protein Nup160